jgi:serine/threonine-protein kinase
MPTPQHSAGREATPSYRAPPETPPAGSAPPSPSETPDHIGRYRVVRWLGGGGMGDVYLATDPQLNDRRVAVKVPRFDGPPERRESQRRRFLQEAAAAASVPHHAHVCPVYDHGESDGRPFLVMAFVEGGTLADRLQDLGRFEDVREVVLLVRQAAEGLAALHAAGVIHRDLKPSNILLDHEGTPLLSDFGVARLRDGAGLTADGALVGTPDYMAPEQADEGASAAREPADVYSLGAVLYHLLTGRKPFEGNTVQVLRQLGVTPPPPSTLRSCLDPGLEALTLRMMARRPAERPTAEEVAATLSGWQHGSFVDGPLP